MTIVREPMWDDAPRSRAQGVIRHLTKFLSSLGWAARIMIGSVAAFPAVICRRSGREDLFKQLYVTGIRTLPIITIVSVFIGMILALQVGLELRRFNQEGILGSAVMISLVREMGPFACGMCLASCVGSAIAAELGTMKVNDEIAALEIMSISPIRFLAAPRVLALVVMAPLLAFYCCVAGALGGGIVGVTQLGVDFSQYMSGAVAITTVKDLFVGLIKSMLCGLMIGSVSVAEGFGTTMGASGVGKSTQRSVIVCFLLMLMFGYMITRACYR